MTDNNDTGLWLSKKNRKYRTPVTVKFGIDKSSKDAADRLETETFTRLVKRDAQLFNDKKG